MVFMTSEQNPNGSKNGASTRDDPAVSVYFTVTVDREKKEGRRDLGTFSTCEGLSFEVDVLQREEGGNNDFVHQLPGRVKYQNIKLTRPLNRHSGEVAKWLASMTHPIKRCEVAIEARSAGGDVVARWALHGVIPVKWNGPSLGSEGPKVAMETLELAHHGFLPNP